jgi:hypothetical protein
MEVYVASTSTPDTRVLPHDNPSQRLARLWPQLQSHVMDECMGHGSPAVRGAAMEALDRAVSGAVAAAQRLTLEPGMTPLELTVLMPVEALLRSPHEDARLGAVRIVCHLLQRVGDRLTVGWRAVVAMLVSVAAPPQVHVFHAHTHLSCTLSTRFSLIVSTTHCGCRQQKREFSDLFRWEVKTHIPLQQTPARVSTPSISFHSLALHRTLRFPPYSKRCLWAPFDPLPLST